MTPEEVTYRVFILSAVGRVESFEPLLMLTPETAESATALRSRMAEVKERMCDLERYMEAQARSEEPSG